MFYIVTKTNNTNMNDNTNKINKIIKIIPIKTMMAMITTTLMITIGKERKTRRQKPNSFGAFDLQITRREEIEFSLH